MRPSGSARAEAGSKSGTGAWTGSELVTLCEGDYPDEGERCGQTSEGLCPRVHAVRLDGTLVTPVRSGRAPPLTSERWRCHEGRPVLDVSWHDGKLTLDPRKPGASIDVAPGVWTGRYELRLASNATAERRKCTDAGAFVLDEPIETGIDFAMPTESLLEVPTNL
jgi:hypothetical protein